MAIKYKNAKRLGAGFKTTPVPKKFVRKKTNLYAIEFFQFLLFLGFIGNQIYALINDLEPDIYQWLLGGVFLLAVIICTLENKRYRIAVAGAFLSCLFVGIAESWPDEILYAVTASVIMVFYFLYLHSGNDKYFVWLKSISQ